MLYLALRELGEKLDQILENGETFSAHLATLRNMAEFHPILSIRVKIWKIFEKEISKDFKFRKSELELIQAESKFSKFSIIRLAEILRHELGFEKCPKILTQISIFDQNFDF